MDWLVMADISGRVCIMVTLVSGMLLFITMNTRFKDKE
jgi:hypothetical protein